MIQDLFLRAAQRFATRVAIERGGEKVTFAELDRRSDGLANVLIESGASAGSLIAVLTDDTIEVIVTILAVLKAGCAFVPLDPATPARRLRDLLAEVSPTLFVAGAAFIEAASSLAPHATLIHARAGDGADDVRTPPLEMAPDALCYVFFTSGSTGRPKGIAGRLKGIDHFIRWEIETLGLGEGIRVSQLTSPAFDAFLRDIFTPLCAGGTICIPERRELIYDASSLLRWLDESAVQVVHCVPTLFRSLLSAKPKRGDLRSLRYVLLSGEPLLTSDVGRWTEVFGDRVQLVNLYGPTETTMTKFFYLVKADDHERRSIPIGQPMRGARALVLDEKRRARPKGSVGEIYIRTPFRALGYYNSPELTSEVFVPNPFSNDPNDLVYKTGDRGRVLDDGDFEFLGRVDLQVKIRGVRIELGEIENCLQQHPAVTESAVLAREDSLGNSFLAAYVVAGADLQAVELRAHLLELLPEAMIPSLFVVLEALPRTISGKVDRRKLATRSDGFERSAYVAPRNPTEEVLSHLYSKFLGLPQIGIHDSFFALGGHSLLAAQLLAQIREAFGIAIPLSVLFHNGTVASLGEQVESILRAENVSQVPPLVPVARDGGLPLSFSQQRLWFIDQLLPGDSSFNLSASVRLSGHLDLGAFLRTLDEIVKRHEILRTTFDGSSGMPVQLVAAWQSVELVRVDLSSLPAESCEKEAHRLAKEQANLSFDLTHGPLWRVCLLYLEPQEHAALFAMHHIIGDAWSFEVLVREVAILYTAFTSGTSSPLPDLPVQFADFAAWQQSWLQGPLLDSQVEYWQKRLAGAPPLLDLSGRGRQRKLSNRGAHWPVLLPEGLSEAMRSLSRSEGATLFMTLLAAFKVVLRIHSRLNDVVVGFPIAYRNWTEIIDLIGCFVNVLVLRTDLSGDPSFRELLSRLRRVALEAYAHQDMPFEKLVGKLKVERSGNYNPIYQVGFTLRNLPPESFDLPNLKIEGIEVGSETSQVDLTLHLVDGEKTLSGFIEYSTDLFSEAKISAIARDLERVLKAVSEDADIKLERLEGALSARPGVQQAEEAGLKRLAPGAVMKFRRQAVSVGSKAGAHGE
jgi:amino acid adenylation domain-containing protein